jgi:hypothetical protein
MSAVWLGPVKTVTPVKVTANNAIIAQKEKYRKPI